MGNRNPAFDAYIAKSAEFARPILEKIRKLYHQACPEIEETMKWSFPHFEHKGIVGSMAALKKNKKALATFQSFSPSHKREYVEWVTESKQESTRDRRLAQAVEWMAEGKSRHWKYATKR